MKNKYVQDYCKQFNLALKSLTNTTVIIHNCRGDIVGSHEKHSKYIQLTNKTYKKSDLYLAILNNLSLHEVIS